MGVILYENLIEYTPSCFITSVSKYHSIPFGYNNEPCGVYTSI